MIRQYLLPGVGLLLASAALAQAHTPRTSPPDCLPTYPPVVTIPGGPPMSPTPSQPSPLLDGGIMAGAGSGAGVAGGGGETGSGSLTSGAPNMIGDVGSRGSYLERGNTNGGRNGSPIVGQSAFRIVENEGPRPVDRVFFYFNYFNDVGLAGNNTYDMYRAVFGFEKTVLSGRGSVGVRLPIQVRDGGTGSSIDGFGDLTVIGKAVLLSDSCTGNCLSAGLAVTVPIGRTQPLEGGGNLDSTLVQPWVGFLVNSGSFFVQGFSSAVLPSKTVDTRMLANDLGVGYRLWSTSQQDAVLTAVVPVLEAHLLTPLNNIGVAGVQNGTSQVGTPDQLVLTGGVHFGIRNRSWLTIGAGTTVTGTRLFNWEGIVQYNFGF